MSKPDFLTLSVSDGTEMEAWFSYPETEEEKVPALLLFQEAYGVNGHIRNVATRLSSQGYAVIAPDLFHRTVKRAEIDYTDFPKAKPHLEAMTASGIEADVRAAYEFLQVHDGIEPMRIGAIGFCLGGRVAYLANTILPLSAAVSYYGGGIQNLTEKAGQLQAPHLFFWAGKDYSISTEQVDSVIGAVRAAEKEHVSVLFSNATHGFNCDERSAYQPQAARESWAMTLAFLENKLNA